MLACWIENPDGGHFKKHLSRLADFMWVAEDGLKMQVMIQKQINMFKYILLFACTLPNPIQPSSRIPHKIFAWLVSYQQM